MDESKSGSDSLPYMTGSEFNEKYGDKEYFKLTCEDNVHNGFTFKEGLNEDVLEFDPAPTCMPGGLYFTDRDNIITWVEYGYKVMHWVWDVSIPDDAKVVVMDNKAKCDKFIITNKRCIWEKSDFYYPIIKEKPECTKYIKGGINVEGVIELCNHTDKRYWPSDLKITGLTLDKIIEYAKSYPFLLKHFTAETPDAFYYMIKNVPSFTLKDYKGVVTDDMKWTFIHRNPYNICTVEDPNEEMIAYARERGVSDLYL
jgi:hypothetical protein